MFFVEKSDFESNLVGRSQSQAKIEEKQTRLQVLMGEIQLCPTHRCVLMEKAKGKMSKVQFLGEGTGSIPATGSSLMPGLGVGVGVSGITI